MNAQKLEHYRELLSNLRQRVGGEVNHVVQALQEEVNVNANQSSAPVHMADVASGAVDAEVEVLQTERNILEQVNDALARIEDGKFGTCDHCGAAISEERLKALPYIASCVRCAREESKRGGF
jgi:DnaK suppressor protein